MGGAASTQAAITSYLAFGVRGSQVVELQNTLTQLGYYKGPISGYFGPLTRNAVMNFQSTHTIPALGIVGPLTRAALGGSSYPPSSPSISSLSPSSGTIGSTVTVGGAGFTKSSIVSFDTQRVATTFINSTTLTFVVPEYISPYCPPGSMCAMYMRQVTPGTYNVSVINGSTQSSSTAFTVTATIPPPPPSSKISITSIIPSSGPIGTQVTIKGTNFDKGGIVQGSIVNFGNGFITNVTVVDSTTITFIIPSSVTGGCRAPMMCPNYFIPVTAGTYNVSVTSYFAGGDVSNTVTFTVTSY